MSLAITPVVDKTGPLGFALLARRGHDASARTEPTGARPYVGADRPASGRGARRSAADPLPVAQAEGRRAAMAGARIDRLHGAGAGRAGDRLDQRTVAPGPRTLRCGSA